MLDKTADPWPLLSLITPPTCAIIYDFSKAQYFEFDSFHMLRVAFLQEVQNGSVFEEFASYGKFVGTGANCAREI
jgi:hypothetical protein